MGETIHEPGVWVLAAAIAVCWPFIGYAAFCFSERGEESPRRGWRRVAVMAVAIASGLLSLAVILFLERWRSLPEERRQAIIADLANIWWRPGGNY